jgi:hypothetical protein
VSIAALIVSFALQDGVEFFEKRIRPILVERCSECHAQKVKGGLRVDSRAALLKGGDSGPAIVPGKPEESLLIRVVRGGDPDLKMPPKNPLPKAAVEDLARWVAMGAPDPRDVVAVKEGPRGPSPLEGRKHWAFRPLREGSPPAGGHPVDAFLDARVQAPAPEADRATLVRRVTFDLTGLPPTAAEVEDFVRNGDWDRVLDRLLASPRYGEKWGRRWLDLVRYADSNGVDEDVAHPHAWRYRDWVVRAFNDDLPYDRFIIEQIAGDLLTEPNLVAPAWMALGPKMLAEPDLEKMRLDIVDEQIDVATKTFLGLTVSCARCHDHKFDPIPTADYYALAGIFRSVGIIRDYSKRPALLIEHVLPDPLNEDRRAAHSAAMEEAYAGEIGEADSKKAREHRERRKKLEESGPDLPRSFGPREEEPRNLAVHVRGNPQALGKERIPRGTPQVFEIGMAAPSGSGRLQLARWLADPANPLTARVMVNRLWQAHFREGLVRTASNFGYQGEAPSHPELLDWLAREFIRGGWSVKRMQRLLLTSGAYRRSTSGALRIEDPENRLLARQNRRRLDAEEIRDAVLAVSGTLDLKTGGVVPGMQTDGGYWRGGDALYTEPRRTLWLPVARHKTFDLLPVFDYADTAVHLEKRPTTTVPQQALFMLNHPLVKSAAASTSKSLAGSDEDKLRSVWLRLFARPPGSGEVSDAFRALERFRGTAGERWAKLIHALMASNGFLFLD